MFFFYGGGEDVVKLTEKQKRFVDEYLIDLNATRAYKSAYPTVKNDETAASAAARMLRNVKVEKHIDERMKAREKRTEITQDMVLRRWWDIANADPNELIQLRRLNCRYCHGIDHEYQWQDKNEYQKAVSNAIAQAEIETQENGNMIEPNIPTDVGGYGFDRLADPDTDCPKCRGEGNPDIFLADTRKLEPKSKMLYAGIKQTQAGIEIKFRDQDKALENVARHLGMFKDNTNINLTTNQKLEDFFK
ncbi:MAG: Terminase small subunit [Neobacillus sp.]|nr:Terminase small subunit [Neobacillus sp.]